MIMSIVNVADDIALARDVREATQRLNDMLRRAYDAGLLVKIDKVDHRTVSKSYSLEIYRAEVWRSV